MSQNTMGNDLGIATKPMLKKPEIGDGVVYMTP
jgi:hypothetical protein